MNDNDKLENLMQHLLDQTVYNCYIENDAFVIEFGDGTLIELYSDDGDLDIYFQLPQEPPPIH